MVELNALGQLYVLKMWLVVKKALFLQNIFSNKSSFTSDEFHENRKAVTKLRLIWPHTVFWDITTHQTVGLSISFHNDKYL